MGAQGGRPGLSLQEELSEDVAWYKPFRMSILRNFAMGRVWKSCPQDYSARWRYKWRPFDMWYVVGRYPARSEPT
jgi:hypothetical protein